MNNSVAIGVVQVFLKSVCKCYLQNYYRYLYFVTSIEIYQKINPPAFQLVLTGAGCSKV